MKINLFVFLVVKPAKPTLTKSYCNLSKSSLCISFTQTLPPKRDAKVGKLTGSANINFKIIGLGSIMKGFQYAHSQQ
ncbi:hypothetical protein AQ505_03630 [Pedobacter sp. PACM 27299]|nr:hypothetical protein AQ505_03630 [Pedobacter sp. PACM 27299]